MQVEERINVTKKKNRDILTITWCIEDVLETDQAKENKLTDEEAREVLELQDRKHDANYGVSWDTIADCVEEIVKGRQHDNTSTAIQ